VDEETSTIKQHIDNEREELGRNLDEIEDRVKKATDLKTHFDRNTAWILGGAVAGGFLLSRLFHKSAASGRSPRWETNATERNTSTANPRSPSHLSRLSETLDNIFEGLVGVVSNKLHSFVADAVPGFGEEYDAIERQRGRASAIR
jgi:hypothetical protein